MAGISSKAAGNLENKIKFQGQEFNDAFDVDFYEFKYRQHDPQIGRFTQIDPLADKYVYNSTYAFSENRVINAIELEGLEAVIITNTYDKDNKLTGTSTINNEADNYGPLGNGTYTVNRKADGTFSEEYKPGEGNSVNGFYQDGISQSRWIEGDKQGGYLTRLEGRLVEKMVEDGLVAMGFDIGQVQKDVTVLETDNKDFKGRFAGFANSDAANKYTASWDDRSFSDPHQSTAAKGSGGLSSSGIELKYYNGAKSATDNIPGHIDMSKTGLRHISDYIEGLFGSGNPGLSNAKEYKKYQEKRR